MRRKITVSRDYLSFLSCYARGSERLPYRPLFLMIEPTNACNLKCVMCPQSGKLSRAKGFMSMELFVKIIEEARGFTQSLQLFHSGEPLLHRNLPEMIKMSSERGIYTIINSNAALLNAGLAEELIRAGLDLISISFDGFDKAVYESVRAGATYETTLGNIKSLIELKRSMKASNPRIVMEIIDMKQTSAAVPAYREEALALGADEVRIWKYQNWTEPDMIDSDRFPRKKVFYPCEYPYTILAVLWDGTVVPCCMDYNAKYPLGNAAEQSILEIWNGSREQSLRKAFRTREESSVELCRDCSFLWEPKSYCTLYGKLFERFAAFVGSTRRAGRKQ